MFGFLKKKRALDRDALKGLVDGLVQGQARVELHDTPERTVVVLHADPARGGALEELRTRVEAAVRAECEHAQIVLTAEMSPKASYRDVSAELMSRKAPSGPVDLPFVKHVILVASGKGGVGKSTVTAGLAHAFKAQGMCVGVLDADIYGPSQPRMFGLSGQKPEGEQGRIQPLHADGIALMSIGFMVDEDAALVWRGPIVQKALMQLTQEVAWGDKDAIIDILLVDMPPGTGDVPLSIAQKLNVDGAVIISTPQDIALLDVRKGIAMFERVNVPILGVVENMATHICSNCGHEEAIFGHGGAEAEAKARGVPFLGRLPLNAEICLSADSGQIKAAPFAHIAKALAAHFERF